MANVRQLFRQKVDDIGRSDILKLFGVWSDGRLLTAHEAVLFQRKLVGGTMKTVPLTSDQMELLHGADCFDTGGALLGHVDDFDIPALTAAHISPLVRIEPVSGLDTSQELSWAAGTSLPVAKIRKGLQVAVLDSGGVTAQVDEEVGDKPYLTTKEVRAAILSFNQRIQNLEGSPVVVATGADKDTLVGMLFNIRTAGGVSFAYCLPAAEI
jgi:hypothetical protein